MTDSTGAGARRSHRGVLGTAATALGLGLLLAAAGAAPAFATTTPPAPAPRVEVLAQSLALLADEASGTGGAEGSGSAAIGDTLDPTLGLTFDDQGRTPVTVLFASADALDAARDAVAGSGEILTVTTSQPTIVVTAAPTAFEQLAALPGVVSVRPVQQPVLGHSASATIASAPASSGNTACNPLDVEADAPGALNSAAARERFGVDGTGVKVGIISDSFAVVTDPYRTMAEDIAAGALPGSTNPCGYTTDILIIEDGNPKLLTNTDEGRAMAQLVHGVAPGAELMFATAGANEAAYADNINRLVEAGADIIVDDATFPDEPLYQEGVVGTGARKAVEQGVLYLSAAQNQSSIGQASQGTEPGFRDDQSTGSWTTKVSSFGPCPEIVAEEARAVVQQPELVVDCQNFAREGHDPLLRATMGLPLTPEGTLAGTIKAQWAEPVWGVETVFLIIALDEDGTALVPQSPGAETTTPYASTEFAPPAGIENPASFTFALVRLHLEGFHPGTPEVRIQFMLDDGGVSSLGDGRGWADGVTIGPSIWGHAGDESVLTVGAASVLTPDVIEDYSGVGPVRYLWEPATGTKSTPVPIIDPVTRSKPDVVSVDQSLTTFFPAGAKREFRFGGTSAATPNAGAVAALGLEYSPDATAEQLRHALVSTATAMPEQRIRNVSRENVTGTGRVEAVNALAALPAPAPTPSPTPTPTPDAGGGNRLADTGADVTGASGGLIGMAVIIAAGIALVALGRATAIGGRGRRG
ncbi:S8 family serine peptidase [Herbiconiux sp. A18JL235]|uniref:S8 family serine peptidase n=1 Tax=Herbiconiux sp. A18JL235 TaxID=3152363 RepID=A0AB39BJR5_9MICO